MADTTPILSLPFIQPSQAQKHVTHNEALRSLDVMVQPVVADRSLTAAPGTPTLGERHIVAPGATGAWAGQDANIAWWTEAGWDFMTPADGWRVHVLAESRDVIFDSGGGGWLDSSAFAFSAKWLGINATADATNRLSISSPATLFNHEGAGHQLKINKGAAADTASVLFQDAFSGRAEMGLSGDDDFHLKVSADGTTWIEALVVEGASGHVTGSAVQSSATDTTVGRLARADYAYGPGNLVGTVSESGGVPTGAVIERGSNANGDYTRFADGTQICISKTLSGDATTAQGALFRWVSSLTWTFPAVFSAAPHVGPAYSNNAKLCWPTAQTPTSSDVVVNLLSAISVAGRSARYMAIGRWY